MPAELQAHLSVDLLDDLSQLLSYHFMVNALVAGSIVAVLAGVLGWFMVLRREVFAGHTLAMMAFPGASAAALAGVAAAWGYFLLCGLSALAIAAVGATTLASSQRSAVIGMVQAVALAVGFLLLSLYHGVLGSLENLLFGTLLGVSEGQVLTLFTVAVGCLLSLGVIARPLLLCSVDDALASAQGVPVRALSFVFLILLGMAVAETSQITGVLLVLTLLVGAPASAQVLTPRPLLSLTLSVCFALLIVWLGLSVAYFSVYPAGFFMAVIAFVIYLLARGADVLRRRLGDRGLVTVEPVELGGVIS